MFTTSCVNNHDSSHACSRCSCQLMIHRRERIASHLREERFFLFFINVIPSNEHPCAFLAFKEARSKRFSRLLPQDHRSRTSNTHPSLSSLLDPFTSHHAAPHSPEYERNIFVRLLVDCSQTQTEAVSKGNTMFSLYRNFSNHHFTVTLDLNPKLFAVSANLLLKKPSPSGSCSANAHT